MEMDAMEEILMMVVVIVDGSEGKASSHKNVGGFIFILR
jgi:hypothetical protein